MKKASRGALDAAFNDNSKIALVRWKNNSAVTLTSNKLAVAPIEKAKRWSVAEKKSSVDQSFIVQRYNASMGGTDRIYQSVSCYRTAIRTTKWWWPMFL